MIKANELRIGNYYYEGVNILIVRTLKAYPSEKYSVNNTPLDDPDINPIPLTEEWLLKFGFKYDGHNCYTKDNMLYCIEDHTFQFDFDDNNFMHKVIDSVHQLQNLYFALTGEELLCK
jgi:hypothetical protein